MKKQTLNIETGEYEVTDMTDEEVAAFEASIAESASIRRLVLKSVIVDRLQEAGLLEAARAALNSADVYTQERWNTRDRIYSDDPTALGMLRAIGADPEVILA